MKNRFRSLRRRRFWHLRSRTVRWAALWLPAFAAALAALEANLGLLQAYLGPWQYVVLAALVAAVQVRLRAVTEKPLSDYRDDADA